MRFRNKENALSTIKAPFQYAGSKHLVFPFMEPIIRDQHWDNYYEPFCGSMSVGLSLINADIADDYHLSELNPQIISYWWDIRDYSDVIINDIKSIFKDIKNNLSLKDNDVDQKSMIKEYHKKYLLDPFNNGGLYNNTAYFIVLMKLSYNTTQKIDKSGVMDIAPGDNDIDHFGAWINPKIDLITNRVKQCSKLLNKDNVFLNVNDFFDIDYKNEDNLIYLDPPYENSLFHYSSNWNDSFNYEVIKRACYQGLNTHNSLICSNSLISPKTNEMLQEMIKRGWCVTSTSQTNRTGNIRKRDSYNEVFYHINVV